MATRERIIPRSSIISIGAIALCLLCLPSNLPADLQDTSSADNAADVDWPLFEMPRLPDIPLNRVFDDRFIGLWQQALARPDVETRRRAVQDIGRAHELGMKGLDVFLDTLVKQINDPSQHPVLVITIAKALIQMDASSAADSLFKLNEKGGTIGVIRGSTIGNAGGNGGIELVLMTDPVLAKWKHGPAIKLWLTRLRDQKAPRPVRLSAIDSLATVGNTDSLDLLRSLVTDRALKDTAIRLRAARAVATLQPAESETLSKTLAEQGMIDRLIAATLLSNHKGDAAIKQLLEFAQDKQSAVANLAVVRLLEIDPALLEPIAITLLARRDAKLRLGGAKCLAKLRNPAAVTGLLKHLDDHDPTVRQFARKTLIDFGTDAELVPAIRSGALAVLKDKPWRGIEQAAILLGRIDHKPAATELVKLLPHPRDEVKLATIVALRRLAVAETLPEIHKFAVTHTDAWLKDVADRRGNDVIPYEIDEEWDKQLSQLFQLFGLMQYKPAEPLMRRYIPKNSGFWTFARGGAIWGLGMMKKDKPDDGFVTLLRSRLSDIDPNNPEMLGVRRASAIAIGWMKAEGGLKTLRLFLDMEGRSKDIGGSCRWSIMRITGETIAPLAPRELRETGWFISPTDPLPERP